MTDFVCRLVYNLPLPVIHIMWYPFLYLVDRPLTKLIGPIKKTGRTRWFVEIVATMQNRGIHI